MEKGNLPTKYLGLPLFKGAPKNVTFQYLISKIKSRLQGWKASCMSQAARLILIKHVLSSIPIYATMVYKLPKSILKEIEKAMRNFLWRQDSTKALAAVKWQQVCKPTKEGGLGIRRPEEINRACLLKKHGKC